MHQYPHAPVASVIQVSSSYTFIHACMSFIICMCKSILVDPLCLEMKVLYMKNVMKKKVQADETHPGAAGKTFNMYM